MLLLVLTGCGDDPDALEEMTPESALGSQNAAPLERLLEPFDPPPLEELSQGATWIDRPVLDAVVSLREEPAAEPQLATPEEALALINDSVEANAKILSALGRVARAWYTKSRSANHNGRSKR